MKRLVYVTARPGAHGVGGREQLTRLHHKILNQLLHENLEHLQLDGRATLGKPFGYLDGVSRLTIDLVLRKIKKSEVEFVFLDGSNLGILAKKITLSFPNVTVITFFHNCEARFFLGALRRSSSPKALAVLFSNYLAERSAVRFSNIRICLNVRDSKQLDRIYGAGATHFSAMALQDRLLVKNDRSKPLSNESYALFVGGAFYANQSGIQWFCQQVAPRIGIKTCVVGRGLEQVSDDLERYGNVTVIGEVDCLADWYRDARFVIAPIFDGSGMKTKVAEALMFGKRVIGTPEAFTGYEEIAAEVGQICNTADDFVRAISLEVEADRASFDPKLRAIFEEKYSLAAALARFSQILDSPCLDLNHKYT